MNGTRPSEGRIAWTTKSLNFSLPVLQSIKELANATDPTEQTYQKDTVRNSGLLFDVLRSKFGVWREEVSMHVDFDANFYRLPMDDKYDCESPSEVLNTAYTQVHAFVRKQYTKIIDDYNVITSENNNLKMMMKKLLENMPNF